LALPFAPDRKIIGYREFEESPPMIATRPMTETLRVKFISRVGLPDLNVGSDYLRRFPGRVPVWGNCRFILDRASRDYDWLVVYDDLPRSHPVEELACPRENTLFITGEPSSITHYGRHFLAQFGHVLTGQEPWAIKHPAIIRQQPGLLWYYGGSDQRGTFDALAAASPPVKSKAISSVCSSKAMRHTLHAQRLAFTKRLMRDVPELDVFGYGMGHLDNKADAIDPYRYHLVIENHSCPHHWTEKLADAFLGFSLPVYFGCTNLEDYFPAESYLEIDIRDYDGARARILDLLSGDEYEQRLPAIIEARRRVLHEYSTFPQLARLIALKQQPNPAPKRFPPGDASIHSRRAVRRRSPLGWPAELWVRVSRLMRRS